jgi:hypothetical protein
MEAAIEIVTFAELTISDLAHARHDSHAQNDVYRIGKLDPDFGQARPGRAH